MTTFDISPKFTFLFGEKGAKRRSKLVKSCPFPYKLRYKCYFGSKGQMRCGEDAKVTYFYISSKFLLSWQYRGGRISKWVKIMILTQFNNADPDFCTP